MTLKGTLLLHYIQISFFLPLGVDSNKKCVYLNGCSLGLQPMGTKELVDNELEKWQKRYIIFRMLVCCNCAVL